jgi:hypothetical protein
VNDAACTGQPLEASSYSVPLHRSVSPRHCATLPDAELWGNQPASFRTPARFQVLRKGQVLPVADPGPPGLSARTLISRAIGPHPAPAYWGVSVACQEPAAGQRSHPMQQWEYAVRRTFELAKEALPRL